MIFEVDIIASFQIRKFRIREIKYLTINRCKWQISVLPVWWNGTQVKAHVPKNNNGVFLAQDKQEDSRLNVGEHANIYIFIKWGLGKNLTHDHGYF